MKPRGNNYGARYLQKHHIDYLKLYASELTQAQLAQATGYTQATICYWLKNLRLVAKNPIFQRPGVVIPPCTPEDVAMALQQKSGTQKWLHEKRVPVYTPDPPKKKVRPPARYDNMSREDHINKYLNMDI